MTSAFNGQGRPFPIFPQLFDKDFDPSTLGWWQTVQFPDGQVVKGIKTAEVMQHQAGMFFNGVDLKGKSFIDVGACNGGFTIQAKLRGASRLAAMDRYHMPEDVAFLHVPSTISYVSQRWEAAIEIYACNLDNPRLDLSNLGQFDVVLFAGVFYHLLNPLSALREVAMMARETLIVETHEDNTLDSRPGMVFYPGREVNNDGSTWWGPNAQLVIEFLRVLGFTRFEIKREMETRFTVQAFREDPSSYFRKDLAQLELTLDR